MENHNWEDLEPLEQDDSQTPLCPILYQEGYKTAMNYFRAIVKKGEMSRRALDLTSDILIENASHYSVWKYRLDILNALKSEDPRILDEEWIFLNELAGDNPKSYQIWHQRQALQPKVSAPEQEMDFLNRMIENDSKNYHAWSYRQWLVKKYSMWDFELRDTKRLIHEDAFNNSAWNQRYFVLKNTLESISEEMLSHEIEFLCAMIELNPDNESPWNYLQGFKQF